MPAITDLKEELDDLTTMKFIASAFTEASAARIKNIRTQFERNREFYDEISQVYHLVRVSAYKLKLIPGGKGVTPPKAPDAKILSVAITSNQRFYGSLNINIMRKYAEETEKQKTELLVIGSTGLQFMKSSGFIHPYDTYNFAKDTPSSEELKGFLEKTKDYDSVFLYYPKFATLLSQTVGVIDITQFAVPKELEPKEEIKILFEPELSNILEFFQTTVRSLLFLRVMLEVDLARTAARLVAMSAAEERSDELIKDKKSQLRKTMTSLVNRQLLETFSGMSKWKK